MAKIKQTYKGTLHTAGFGENQPPTATFAFATGEPVLDENGETLYSPQEIITLPVDAKRLLKLINVTDVEVTISVTPKGTKKPRKARKAKNATVETTTVPTTPEA